MTKSTKNLVRDILKAQDMKFDGEPTHVAIAVLTKIISQNYNDGYDDGYSDGSKDDDW